MATYHFQQYWGYATADVACRLCGRISRRRIREYCTVNPFNKREDGTPKQAAEVQGDAMKCARREAARQTAEGRICRKCENQAVPA